MPSQQEAIRNLRRRFSKEEIKKILSRDQTIKNPRHTIEGARVTNADKDTRKNILKRLLAPNMNLSDEITDKIKQMIQKTAAKAKDLDKDPTIKTVKADTPKIKEIEEMKNSTFGPDDYKTTNKQPGKKNKQYGDMLKKNLSKRNKGNFSVGYNGNKL